MSAFFSALFVFVDGLGLGSDDQRSIRQLGKKFHSIIGRESTRMCGKDQRDWQTLENIMQLTPKRLNLSGL